MIITKFKYSKTVIAIVVTLALAACASSPTTPAGAVTARNNLTQLQSNSELANRARIEIQQAELAVAAAEKPESDQVLSTHLVLIANRKVEIAKLWAQSRLYEDQRAALSQASDEARLAARTRETNVARRDTAAAKTEIENLERQIMELNARNTDRGLVVTLGDVLFATGNSTIVGSNDNNLGKLAVFLNRYDDRQVTIEGHTDSVGSDSSNMGLSQRRADAVKNYLIGEGVAASRLTAFGKGENSPVSANDTATGRQQNRRVEVIIADNPSVVYLN